MKKSKHYLIKNLIYKNYEKIKEDLTRLVCV